VRHGLAGRQQITALPQNFQNAANKLLELKQRTGWDHRFNDAAAGELHQTLRQNGFGGPNTDLATCMRNFNQAMTNHFQTLGTRTPPRT